MNDVCMNCGYLNYNNWVKRKHKLTFV